MKGIIVELNQEFGYIQGIDQNKYFFNKIDLEEPLLINQKVFFRANKEIVSKDYTIYKATNIEKDNNE